MKQIKISEFLEILQKYYLYAIKTNDHCVLSGLKAVYDDFEVING